MSEVTESVIGLPPSGVYSIEAPVMGEKPLKLFPQEILILLASIIVAWSSVMGAGGTTGSIKEAVSLTDEIGLTMLA